MTSPTATSPTQTLRHIPELDGIRGIAALAVIFHHLCHSTVPLELARGWHPAVSFLWRLTEWWSSGVDLFFVLSGFLITSILLQIRLRKNYYQDFYWKRVLRILPLYILCLILWYVVNRNLAYTALAAAFLVNFASVFHLEGVSVFWTLSIEEQFYLIWPTIIRRRTVEQVRKWGTAMVLSAVVLRFLFALRGHHNYYLTFLHWDTLACGALLACHFHTAGRDAHRRHRWDLPLGVAAAGSLAILTVILSRPIAPMGYAWLQTAITLAALSAIGLAISFSGAAVLAPLRSRVLVFFGLISYALYMLHFFVLEAYDHLFGAPTPSTSATGYWLRIVAVLSVSVVFSLLSRYCIELPAMSLRPLVLRARSDEAHTPIQAPSQTPGQARPHALPQTSASLWAPRHPGL